MRGFYATNWLKKGNLEPGQVLESISNPLATKPVYRQQNKRKK